MSLLMPATQETQIRSLGWEDPRENGMATQYSCLENSMGRRSWWTIAHGVPELDTTEQLTHTHTHTHTRIFEQFWRPACSLYREGLCRDQGLLPNKCCSLSTFSHCPGGASWDHLVSWHFPHLRPQTEHSICSVTVRPGDTAWPLSVWLGELLMTF